LKGMKWLDNDFDTYEPELFEKKMLNFNRAMLSQEEAEEFDQRIEAVNPNTVLNLRYNKPNAFVFTR
jgi:hypothetical protein